MDFSCMLNRKTEKVCTQPKLPLFWANIFKLSQAHFLCFFWGGDLVFSCYSCLSSCWLSTSTNIPS